MIGAPGGPSLTKGFLQEHLEKKPVCLSWAAGGLLQGLIAQEDNGTVGLTGL